MYPLQRFHRVHALGIGDLDYPLRTERVLGVDDDDVPVQPALFDRHGGVHGQLEHHLGLPAPELAEELMYGLGFKSPAKQFIESFR